MSEEFKMQYEFLQPWSAFVMATKLPSPILETMIKITDDIVENAENEKSYGELLAGQIKDELWIGHEILEREEVMGFFLDVVRTFVIQQTCQMEPFKREKVLAEEWYINMLSMWVVSQKDNEYNPIHIHNKCDISTVMYLKIPEYLPSRKSNNPNNDGAICFTNNAVRDQIWGVPNLQIQPQEGDFFIFPASQHHLVYPFRTADGEGERRSVSFNASFTSKTEQDRIKQQEEQEVI